MVLVQILVGQFRKEMVGLHNTPGTNLTKPRPPLEHQTFTRDRRASSETHLHLRPDRSLNSFPFASSPPPPRILLRFLQRQLIFQLLLVHGVLKRLLEDHMLLPLGVLRHRPERHLTRIRTEEGAFSLYHGKHAATDLGATLLCIYILSTGKTVEGIYYQ